TQVPYSYSTFAHGKATFLLGYVTDDQPTLATQGVKIGYLLISKSGLDPYADILFGLHSYVESHKGLLTRFDGALAEGWQYYRNHGLTVNPTIHAANPATPTSLDNAIYKAETSFIFGAEAATKGIGTLTAMRVDAVYKSLEALKVLTKPMKLSTIVTTGLMPKKLPPARS
ncbi:MAG TPA: ABC transporter substrate-binding protein, partial [Acidimicrobiales bacterium]|nr:ABC transporter substrate-binding protein [Acidimicrobiales bacterium]